MVSLACIDVFDVLLSLAAVGLLLLALLYAGVRLGIAALARSARCGDCAGKPWSLFAAALLIPVTANSIVVHAALFWRTQNDSVFELLVWAVVLALLAALPAALNRAEPQQSASNPPHPRAIWLQDLLLAAFAFAVALLTLAQCFPSLPGDASAFFQAALALALFQAEGFALALNLCRTSALGQRPIYRAAAFGSLMLFAPLTFPALALAWFMWRKALKRARGEQAALRHLPAA